jgi:SAM-dependent methyltransferase
MFVNIKIIRKATNFIVDFIYLSPFKIFFLWLIARIPIKFFFNNFWINSPQYYKTSFKEFLIKMRKAGVVFNDKNILEIGSGSSFGWGYFFIISGAKSYTSSDLVRSANMSTRALRTELSLIRLVEEEYKKKILGKYVAYKDKKIIFLTRKLQFKLLDITEKNLKIDQYYDIIISNAVLEHLPKKLLSRAVNNMYQLLKPNGLMLHQIDLRDHYNFREPFHFYQYSDMQWNYITNLGYFYTNRLRPSDFISLFRKNNFKIIYTNYELIKENINKIRRRIHNSFFKYSNKDLAAIGFTIAGKK